MRRNDLTVSNEELEVAAKGEYDAKYSNEPSRSQDSDIDEAEACLDQKNPTRYNAGHDFDMEISSATIPDMSSIEGFMGNQLRMATESILMQPMMRRSDANGSSSWQAVLTDQMQDRIIQLDDFKILWYREHGDLEDNEVIALFTRFGNPNDKLEKDLLQAKKSIVNRNYEWNQCWINFNCQVVRDTYSQGNRWIDQQLLCDFLKEAEVVLNLVEIQISRSDVNIIDGDLVDSPLSSGILRSLLQNLGIIGLDTWQIEPIVSNTLISSGKSPGSTTLLDLQSFCTARANRVDRYGSKSTESKGFYSLIQPFTYRGAVIRDAYGDGDEDAVISDPSTPNVTQNVLALFSTLPMDSSGSVKYSDFVSAVITNFPSTSPAVIKAFGKCVSRRAGKKSLDGVGDVIPQNVLEVFCFPKGFSLSVTLPLGSFKARNSKVKPLDFLSKIYTLAAKQLFSNLRKHVSSTAQIRVPDDLKLFLDSDCTKYVPNSATITVVSIMDDNTRLYGKSQYVTDLLETEGSSPRRTAIAAKRATTAPAASKVTGTGAAAVKSPNSPGSISRKGKAVKTALGIWNPATSSGPRSSTEYAETDANITSTPIRSKARRKKVLSRIPQGTDIGGHGASPPIELTPSGAFELPPSKTFTLPPPQAFLGLESDAHNWGIPMTIKYVVEELELGEHCREPFLRCEVTGLKFITLSEEKISPLGIPHSAHRAKILAHSKMLLEAVLSKALTRRPLKNLDWCPEHVAAWLYYTQSCQMSAKLIMQEGIRGSDIPDMTYAQLAGLLEVFASSEAPRATCALKEMFIRNSSDSAVGGGGVLTEGEGEGEGEEGTGVPESNRPWSGGGVGTGPYSPTCVTTVRGTRGTDPRPSTALKGRRVKEKKSVKRRMRGVDSEGEGFGEGEREIKRLGGLEESFEEEEEEEEDILDVSSGSKMGKSVERNNENTKNIVQNTELEIIQFFGKNEFPSPTVSTYKEPAVSMIIGLSPRQLKSAGNNSKEITKHVNTENNPVLSPSKGILKSPKKKTELTFFNDFGKEIENDKEKEVERGRDKEKETERERLRDIQFEEERRNFESRILSLQQVVENQSKSVADLRDLTATLRLEKMATGLAMENVEKEKKILEKSRNETAILFDNLTQKFVTEMETEKLRLKEEISALSLSPLSLSIPHPTQQSLPASSNPSPLALTAISAYTLQKQSSPQGQSYPSPFSNSTLSSPLFPTHAKLEQISSPESRTDARRTDRLYEDSHTNLALTQETLDNNFIRLNKKYEMLKGLPYPDENPPVNNKKEIEKKQRKNQEDIIRKEIEMEMKEKMDKDKIQRELELWSRVLRIYRLPSVYEENRPVTQGKRFRSYSVSEDMTSDEGEVTPSPPISTRHISQRKGELTPEKKSKFSSTVSRGIGSPTGERSGWVQGEGFFAPRPLTFKRRRRTIPGISVSVTGDKNETQDVYIASLLRILSVKWIRLGLSVLEEYRRLKDLEGKSVLGIDDCELLSILHGLHTCARTTCTNIKKKVQPSLTPIRIPDPESVINIENKKNEKTSEHKNPKKNKEEKERSAVHSDQEIAFSLVFSLALMHGITAVSGLVYPTFQAGSVRKAFRSDSNVMQSQSMFLLNQVKNGDFSVRESSIPDFVSLLAYSLRLPVTQVDGSGSPESRDNTELELILQGVSEAGKNSIKIEDLFCAFRNLIPLSTPVGTGPARFDDTGRTKRTDRMYEDLARTNRLDRGQTCTLFLLSVASQGLLERHLAEKEKSSGSGIGSGGRSRRKESASGLRSIERSLAHVIEEGATRGVLSFRQILKYDPTLDSVGTGVRVGPGVGSDMDMRERALSTESDGKDTQAFSESPNGALDGRIRTNDSFYLLCEVVTDILFELSEPVIGNEAFATLPRSFFADNAQTENSNPRSLISSRHSTTVGKLPKLPQRDIEKHSQPEIRFPLFLDILRYNLRSVCAECARALEVYNDETDRNEKKKQSRDSPKRDHPPILLSKIVKLFVKVLHFRVGCIQEHFSEGSQPRSTVDPGPKVPSPASPSRSTSGLTPSVSLPSAASGTLGQGVRAVHGPGTQRGSKSKEHIADEKPQSLSQSHAQGHSRIRTERSETTKLKKTGELRREEMEIVTSHLSKLLNYREKDESVDLISDGITGSSSSFSSLCGDIPCVCGWPLPIGDLGVVGSQKQVEFWLFKIQEYQKSIGFSFSGWSGGRIEPTRGEKAENHPKERGDRDREKEKERRGPRKSDSERDKVDNYISSDEEEEEEGYNRGRGLAGIRGRKKNRDQPTRGAYGSTLQSLRLSLSVSGSDSGVEGDGGRDRKRVFGVMVSPDPRIQEGVGKPSMDPSERCIEDNATEKSILSGKYSSGKTSTSARSIKWDDETHGGIGDDVQKEETLLTYLSLLNQKATMLREKLRELLQYRAITVSLKKGDSTESEQKVADMKYIIGSVRVIKSRLESADKQTLDPKLLAAVTSIRSSASREKIEKQLQPFSDRKSFVVLIEEISTLENSLRQSRIDAALLATEIIENFAFPKII